MKKVILGILVFICLINVEAKDYSPLSLIPLEEEANVTTNYFFYHNMSYDKTNILKFESIKNVDNKDRYVSITIGFFNEEKENIGMLNYCSSKNPDNSNLILKQNEEKEYLINISNNYLYKNNKVSDIKYIAVMSDNPNCNNGTNFDFVGKKIEYIEYVDKAKTDYSYLKYCFYILVLIVVILILKFIFDLTINKDSKVTNKILGISEKDRRSNEEIKKEYFERRELEAKKNKKPEEKKDIKDISQEKGNTDLHNMYK